MVRKLAGALFVAGALNSQYASALGLGELQLKSALNQPLKAEIPLMNVGDLTEDQVLVKLAPGEDFEQAGVEREYFLTNLKFKVRLDGKGQGVIEIKTSNLVREPYLDFLIETRWPTGRLLREYTALVDLPVFSEATETTVNLGGGSAELQEAPGAPSTPEKKTEAAPVAQAPANRSTSAAYTSSAMQDSQSYRIKSNDTLWKIARDAKPATDVSVQQTMLAIQQINPGAFIRNNINLLKAGHVLRLPSAEQIREINTRRALQQVAVQNRKWREKEAVSGAELDARKASEERQFAEMQGQLRLTSGEGENTGLAQGGSDAAALQAAEEKAELLTRENQELGSKMSELEAQVEKLQRLIELKNNELASIQAGASQVGSDSPTDTMVGQDGAEDVAAEADNIEALAPDEAEDAAAEQVMQQDDELKDDELKETAEGKVGEAEVAVETPKAPLPPLVSPPAVEPKLLDQIMANPLYLGGGLLVVVAGLVGLLLRKKRKAEDTAEDEVLDEPLFEVDEDLAFDEALEDLDDGADLDADMDFDSTVDLEADASAVASTTQSETGDAIGEADIYVAYGRYQQAADLLNNAIASEPGRTDLRLKLLEVFVEAQDKDGFKSQFSELAAMGDDDIVGQAKELLANIDDGADWIEGAGSDTLSYDAELSLDDTIVGDSTVLESMDSEPDDELSFDSDFTLDLAEQDLDPVEPVLSNLDNEPVSSDVAEAEDLEFSFEAELDEGAFDDALSDNELADQANNEVNELEELTLGESSELEQADFDSGSFELDVLDDELNSVGDEFDASLAELDGALDEGFVGSDDTPAVDSSLDLDVTTDLDESLDDLGANLDQLEEVLGEQAGGSANDSLDISAELMALSDEGQSESDLLDEGDDEELDFLSEADEVATKLDLARAYIDMGDVDGAREILEEVVQEGEEEQKVEADNLLKRIV
jgi:pilus assembly protein FimV